MGLAANLDSDLSALADARAKARQARAAFQAFVGADQARVDNIVRAMADAGTAAAEELARMAVDETGFGVYEDKIVKNLYNTKFVAASMLPMRTVGVLWVDEVNRMTAIGSPMGVVAGIIPVTNPTSTVLFKCLAAVKSGNAIVCAPHPRAAKCSARAAEVMAVAAVRAGAPKGLVSCLSEVTLQATGELMRHPDVSLVLATGGPGMVRAAYSSGKPTLAVGAGNVPVYIHRSVKDVKEAALMAITSKSFDNGTACVAEQSIVLDEPIAEAALAAFASQGTLFLSPSDQEKLTRLIFTDKGELRPDAVGLSAKELARRIGVAAPSDCKVLGANLSEVGPASPLSQGDPGTGPFILSYGGFEGRLPSAAARSWNLVGKVTHSACTARTMKSSVSSRRCRPAESSSILLLCSAAWVTAAPPTLRSCWGPAPGAAPSFQTTSRRYT